MKIDQREGRVVRPVDSQNQPRKVAYKQWAGTVVRKTHPNVAWHSPKGKVDSPLLQVTPMGSGYASHELVGFDPKTWTVGTGPQMLTWGDVWNLQRPIRKDMIVKIRSVYFDGGTKYKVKHKTDNEYWVCKSIPVGKTYVLLADQIAPSITLREQK